jgi:hypothetical protein
MKDAIGQEINVGDKVAHAGMGGARIGGVYDVVNVSEKRVTVMKVARWGREPTKVALRPDTLINVTMNLNALEQVEQLAASRTWRVDYYYLATGMEGRADEWIVGDFVADSANEAIELAILAKCGSESRRRCDERLADWMRSCLSATKIIPESI